MRVKYDVSGMHRKNLAKEIAKWLCLGVKYLGAPSFAYEIGACKLDPDGNLTINTESDNMLIEPLLEHLEDEGYRRIDESPQEAESSGLETEPKNDTEEVVTAAQSEDLGLTVAMPRESFTEEALQNLQKLIDAKGSLIKKALAVDSLPIEVDDEKISFPWFSDGQDGETAAAYTHFITALCNMAKKQNLPSIYDSVVVRRKIFWELYRIMKIIPSSTQNFVNIFEDGLTDSNPDVELLATLCFGLANRVYRLNSSQIDKIFTLLKDPEDDVRETAIKIIRGLDNKEYILSKKNQIFKLLEDSNCHVRYEAEITKNTINEWKA